MKLFVFNFFALFVCLFLSGICRNASSNARPSVVNIGAVFPFDSTIGRVAKVAISAAVNDVNSDPSVLHGTKLVVQMQDTSCNAFIATVKALQFMEKDTVAVIGPQSSVIAHVLSLVSNELQVPLVSFAATDPTLSSLEYPFFVRMTQSDLFQMAAIADIVDYYKWRQVIAIYIDNEYGRNGITSLGDRLQEKRCRISYKGALPPGATRHDVMDLLVKVTMLESRIIVVHANPDLGLIIFSVAQYLQMMESEFVWIATDWLTALLDSSSPLDSDVMNTLQGVLALRQHTTVSKAKNTLVSRWRKLTRKANNGKFQLNTYGLYAYDTVWVIACAVDAFLNDGGQISFSSDPRLRAAEGGTLHLDAMSIFDEGDILLKKIQNTSMTGLIGEIQFDSQGYLIHPAYDVINVIGTGTRIVGYWTNYTGLSAATPEKVYTKATNHSRENQYLHSVIWPGQSTKPPRGWVFPNNGKRLRIGVPKRISYLDIVSLTPNTGTMTGFCIDVFIAAASLLPYAVSYTFIPFGDGRKNPNYNKLVEMVASETFDAAVGDIVITTNRTRVADFTQPFVESGLVILAPIKQKSSNEWTFLQPFTVEMWSITGAFFLVVGGVIWVLEHRINDEFRGPPGEQVVTIFWFSFSTLFFAHRENMVSAMGRVVLIIWLFVVLIIQSSYTASLTSILTVQQLSSPVKGIESLIASDVPIGFQVGSFAESYMVEELRILPSRLRPLDSPQDYAKSLHLGPDNGGVAAVVDERAYVELFLSTECDFAIIGSEFTRAGWGFAFPRDSPLALDMSIAILTLSEDGNLQKIHDKWLSRGTCMAQSDELEAERLHLKSFWGLFLICGVACAIALVVYFALVLRKFLRHVPPTAQESPAGEGRSKWMRVLQSFFTFVDDREEDASGMAKRRQMQKKTVSGDVIDDGASGNIA